MTGRMSTAGISVHNGLLFLIHNAQKIASRKFNLSAAAA